MTHPSTIILHELAHSRSGDKGDRSNLSVIAREPEFYPILERLLTADLVARRFGHRKPEKVVRYDLPRLEAFNFVLDAVLDGGVNSSLGLDGHGKTLSFYLLGLELELDDETARIVAQVRASRHEKTSISSKVKEEARA
ncbi:AtuA-related protein [Phyllobacterium sp. K27]